MANMICDIRLLCVKNRMFNPRARTFCEEKVKANNGHVFGVVHPLYFSATGDMTYRSYLSALGHTLETKELPFFALVTAEARVPVEKWLGKLDLKAPAILIDTGEDPVPLIDNVPVTWADSEKFAAGIGVKSMAIMGESLFIVGGAERGCVVAVKEGLSSFSPVIIHALSYPNKQY